jgi:molybdenum cofactor synthesis domain-containing protein
VRPLKSLISIEEAKRLIDSHVVPIDRAEEVPLLDAMGRVSKGVVRSRIDIPPFHRAAMDGYAVRAKDTFGASRHVPVKLPLQARLHAGEAPREPVREGACIEIATGAVLPEGADAVVMVEYTSLEGDAVHITRPVYPGENVSRAGTDMKAGAVILEDGMVLGSARIGSVAASGFERVLVYAKPRVVVISTGDEVVRPPGPLGAGQIYDVNSFTTAALLAQNGAEVVLRGPCPDETEVIAGCLAEPGADMFIFTGGSSVGERDVLIDALEAHGEIIFHGIAVKPGKPTLFAKAGRQLVFGMPGYPTSCLSNGYMLLAPAVRKMARLPEPVKKTVRFPLGQRIVSTTGRHQFFTVAIRNGLALEAFKESGAITSMSMADGYIEIPSNVDLLEKGEMVDVVLF